MHHFNIRQEDENERKMENKENANKCCQLRKCVASGNKRSEKMHQIDGFTVLVSLLNRCLNTVVTTVEIQK